MRRKRADDPAWRELNKQRAKAWRLRQKVTHPDWNAREAARVKASKVKCRPAFYGFRSSLP